MCSRYHLQSSLVTCAGLLCFNILLILGSPELDRDSRCVTFFLYKPAYSWPSSVPGRTTVLLKLLSYVTCRSVFAKLIPRKLDPSLNRYLSLSLPWCRTFHLLFLICMEVPLAHFSGFLKFPLQSRPAFRHIDCSIKSVIICKIAGTALPHITMVIKDTTTYQS